MNKNLWVVFISAIFLTPLACIRPYNPITPSLVPTATSTPTLTPVCGFTSVSLPAFVVLPAPNPTRVIAPPTPGPVTLISYPTPPATPVALVSTHVPFDGVIIQTLAQWQTYFGAAAAPVDFNTQMILIFIFSRCCFGGENITDACVTSTEVDLTVLYSSILPCNAMCELWRGVVLPQTSLPVFITQTN